MTDGISLEQTVLGHALNQTDCFQQFVADVDWEDFGVPNHQAIAYCIGELHHRGITQLHEDQFQLVIDTWSGDKDYGGSEYIRILKDGYKDPTTDYDKIIESLKLQSVKRRLGDKHLESLLKVLNNPTTSAADIRLNLDTMGRALDDSSNDEIGFYDSKQMSVSYANELDNRVSRKFATTGLPSLDEFLSEGFLPGKLTIMAGFTGMAKSTLSVAMAHRVTVKGNCVCFYSMEMQKEGVWDKMISSLTQIPLVRLKKEAGNLTPDEHGRIEKALDSINSIPILINDRVSMSMKNMRNQILTCKRRGYDPKVVFIDLFGKLEDIEGDNKASRIETEMKHMRAMAQELDVHFVMVVQVGRQGFGRSRQGGIRRPTMIDIKNANAYAEESDLVLLLHRNKYYLPDLSDDILEIGIAKQREGEAGTTCYLEMFADRATIMATLKRPHDIGT